MKSIRILPVFILIATLSFFIRLVEAIDGVVVLSATAHAEDAVKEEEPAEDSSAPVVETPSMDDHAAKPESAAAAPPDTHQDAHGAGEEEFEWRDPTDDDPAYEAARMEVFKDLSKRRSYVEKKEEDIKTREALLKAAEQELDRKFQELSQLRTELEGLLKTQSEEEQKRITSLVKIYEGMKPKDAARIFDTLDLDILLEVCGQMSERKLSPIVAAMNPERAQTLTIMLAEQKQLPSLPDLQ